ncbi:helix-turn-helix transcriptional regulator [bacterium]|nr:helix-turn-helix transcriptional regulator [bacterium]
MENYRYELYHLVVDNKKKLGKRIKELRKQKGLTQEQVAEFIEMEQNTISVIESGRNFPTLVTLEKMATVLGVDLSDFFNYEYFEDIDYIKQSTKIKLEQMNEAQMRNIYKYINNVIN